MNFILLNRLTAIAIPLSHEKVEEIATTFIKFLALEQMLAHCIGCHIRCPDRLLLLSLQHGCRVVADSQ